VGQTELSHWFGWVTLLVTLYSPRHHWVASSISGLTVTISLIQNGLSRASVSVDEMSRFYSLRSLLAESSDLILGFPALRFYGKDATLNPALGCDYYLSLTLGLLL